MARINVTSFLVVLLLLGVLANAVPVAHDHDDHTPDVPDLNSITGLEMEDISNQGVQDGLKAAQEAAARQNAARAAPTPTDGPNFAPSPEPTPSGKPTPSAQPQKPKGPLSNLPIVGGLTGLLGGGLRI
ncbi:hypothetical protein VTN00DRAFT_1463 [Thermoascus crustaceus]|uniref:uncharacterized protein n=1 Tax=Thermoascus crustaceus TaxID=5088 RepID=UPI0037438046